VLNGFALKVYVASPCPWLQEINTSITLKQFVLIHYFKLELVRTDRLRWFRHMEQNREDGWVDRCRCMEIEGKRDKGGPTKTLQEYHLMDTTPIQ